ncbi:AAA family ATPase [Candidatus Microgenomates bacterium]|nr:AAA family ATPase [Candidatus Microgenomates bacterium]
MTLSPDQELALKRLLEWYKQDKDVMRFVTLGGYAGTGKTTLLAVLRTELAALNKSLRVGFVSYTGKAARVLKTKLKEEKILFPQDTVGTIHSLIYSPVTNDRDEIVGWKIKEKVDRDLIIVDEGSMVDGQIWKHLISYGKPIIVVGDHGQLPPIAGNFNLMQKPDLLLSEIHRQEQENPIIALSVDARETGIIQPGKYGPGVVKYALDDPDAADLMNEIISNYREDTLILCGYNSTRRKLNAAIRAAHGFESPHPMSGDRVICLRNNHRMNIFNGMLGTIDSIEKTDDDWYRAEIMMDGEEKAYKGLISVKQFESDKALNYTENRALIMHGDLFDFGYALTVHKAQGSQARRVVLFEERFKQMTEEEWKRWLYTAVTRAEEELYIFAR